MDLRDYLCAECFQTGIKSKNKKDLLREIAALAKKNNILKNISEEKIFDALLERENVGSTGFGNGIAIPHCSFEDLDDFVVGVLIDKKGIDFNSLDGRKAKIFFFIIGPSKERNKHIQVLSLISRLLKSDKNINEIINISSFDEFNKLLSKNFDEEKSEDFAQEAKVLFHVFVQKEKYFDDILQAFSELVEGSISVIETVNAGYFLHAMPLFSTFWSEDKKTYNRVIIAVVDKKLSNNLIRRINTIVDDIEKESGVLITANELFYTNGYIDL